MIAVTSGHLSNQIREYSADRGRDGMQEGESVRQCDLFSYICQFFHFLE